MNTKEILEKYKTIAVVGFSDSPDRDSNRIAVYMKENGFNVIGVNPKLDGKEIDGIKCYSHLRDIHEKINIVNVFRLAIAVPGIVEETLTLNPKPEVIWTQLGIFHDEAKKLAEENGFIFIENKCLYIEHKLNR
ncbi:MAG: CoA-binding protein [Ignavibacteriae bacterium]|nr:CoA-binding protein [Ignavibacteriota bacterium]